MRFTVLILGMSLLGAQDQADLAVVHKIRAEAFQNSKIMETLFYLTDVNGPRVTNSSGFNSAADWAVKELTGYGLANRQQGAVGQVREKLELFALRRAHDGTGVFAVGRISAGVDVGHEWGGEGRGDLRSDQFDGGLGKIQGQLRGKMVLTSAPKDLPMSMTP